MGFFTMTKRFPEKRIFRKVAIPFRVGWGFSRARKDFWRQIDELEASQSLSGWDGVFHYAVVFDGPAAQDPSQSLSGWDGVFHWALKVFYWSIS